MSYFEPIILSEHDVKKLLSMEECISVTADALRALTKGTAVMPVRQVVKLPIQTYGILAGMPSFLHGTDKNSALCATKVITVFPGNAGTKLSAHQGVVILFEAQQGRLLSVSDAHEVTALRTAAASAVATQLLARPSNKPLTLALLGTGVQAGKHLEAICLVRKIGNVTVWGRNRKHAEAFALSVKDMTPTIKVCDTVREAVLHADIICTLTGATKPFLTGDMVKEGAHINAIGACRPTHRELDTSLIVRSRLFVDTFDACVKEPGDIVTPIKEGAIDESHIIGEIGSILLGKCQGRTNDKEITLFKSVGAAIEDLCTAAALYRNANKAAPGTFKTMSAKM